jgi:hypothetical protein
MSVLIAMGWDGAHLGVRRFAGRRRGCRRGSVVGVDMDMDTVRAVACKKRMSRAVLGRNKGTYDVVGSMGSGCFSQHDCESCALKGF